MFPKASRIPKKNVKAWYRVNNKQIIKEHFNPIWLERVKLNIVTLQITSNASKTGIALDIGDLICRLE